MDLDRAIGVHARYFLPALPALAIVAVPSHSWQRLQRPAAWASLFGLVVANALVIVAFLRRYDGSG